MTGLQKHYRRCLYRISPIGRVGPIGYIFLNSTRQLPSYPNHSIVIEIPSAIHATFFAHAKIVAGAWKPPSNNSIPHLFQGNPFRL